MLTTIAFESYSRPPGLGVTLITRKHVGMIESTMQDAPLSITHILRHGRTIFADSKILTYQGPDADVTEATFTQVAHRADQLAAALHRLGVREGDRVGTFMWNNQRHMEAYLAIPCMGAVLHTLNIRLFPDQLAYVINHGEDKVVIVDASIAPLLARVRDQLTTVEHIIVCGEGETSGLGEGLLDYEALIGAEEPGYDYPEIDERAAAAMCYTSGTTGNPKGVAYSHRSCYLHSLGVMASWGIQFSEHERALMIVPQFHAMAWGMPYAGWWCGTDLVMPQQYLQGGAIADAVERTRPTVSGAVPTVLNDVLHNHPDADLSSLRFVICGGSAVPRTLIEGFRDTFGVDVIQAWGMTETSPLAALAWPPRGTAPGDEVEWTQKTGRIVPGVEIRITEDETVLPWDGESQGEIEICGPYITASYYEDDTPEKFHDGWLRTGDVGSIESNGFIQISDRAKDVIKSGGEWISSVDLENTLMGHPSIREAAVIGVPDDRWDERPLACVVSTGDVTADELKIWLEDRVVKWWLPERWTFIEEVPKTSVGKFDKKVLRAQFADGKLDVSKLEH